MSTVLGIRRYKAPRWIHTDAGQWAYEANDDWRNLANQTFEVADRRRLLEEAEALHKRATENEAV